MMLLPQKITKSGPQQNQGFYKSYPKMYFFYFQLFIKNMQFSTSTFGLLQCHDIYAAIEIGLDCRSLDESHLI